jgi:alpha-glucoside transport system permease protein
MSQVKIQTQKSASNDRIRQIFSAAPLRITIIVIALLWTIPSAGLLITSFRHPDDIQTSGWWTVFQHPFELSQYTIQNYQQVIFADGMGEAFLNSLLVNFHHRCWIDGRTTANGFDPLTEPLCRH